MSGDGIEAIRSGNVEADAEEWVECVSEMRDMSGDGTFRTMDEASGALAMLNEGAIATALFHCAKQLKRIADSLEGT